MKLIFLGVQGSGKSTQAKLTAQKLNLPYIEMGQLFREKSQGKDNQARQIKEALSVGSLVSDDITTKTLKERIAQSDCQNGYILDGYPRNQAQLDELPKDIDKVFYIKLSDEEAIKRLTKRGREDDTDALIKRRIQIFHQETEPLLNYFRQMGILKEIGGYKSIEEIAKEITLIIDEPIN